MKDKKTNSIPCPFLLRRERGNAMQKLYVKIQEPNDFVSPSLLKESGSRGELILAAMI